MKALANPALSFFYPFKDLIVQNLFSEILGIRKAGKLVTAAFIGVSCFCFNSTAQGDLLLYPKRIVFEGNKKSQILNLANTGKDTVRYFISVVQVRMKDDGSFETISDPDPGQYFADKNFRFFPRSVVLGPNESQTVKMQITNAAKLEPGEYRSHLYFRSEPEKKPLGEPDPVTDSTSISVKIVAVFGISIPVIIRVGESTTRVSVADESIGWEKDSVPSLKVTFLREGNMSVYGDIAVDHISPAGKTTQVAIAKGAAIYTPNTKRHFRFSLDRSKGVDYRQGILRITYTTPADAKSVKMAEKDLVLKLP